MEKQDNMKMKITIKEYKENLKGLSKEEKIKKIQQALTNRELEVVDVPDKTIELVEEHLPTNKQLKVLQNEIEINLEAYESLTKRKELIPFMYDRDLNWFFNVKNILAQKELVLPTYDFFIEGAGKSMFEPLDFFNFFEKQSDELIKNIEKPFDILKSLKDLPINERERHTLYGFLLKWFGGYPTNNLNEHYYNILKLIEKEFLSFPEDTPEKEFCKKNGKSQKQLAELASHLNAEMPGLKVATPYDNNIIPQHDFTESHYIKKIRFEFDSLPRYIIQKGIIWRFENKNCRTDVEYSNWQKELLEFLNSIPFEHRLKCLLKGIEYGKAVYHFHLEFECSDLIKCALNESWQRRITLAENLLPEFVTTENGNQNNVSLFTINEKSLTKIDFLRLINVLSELRVFKKADGQIPFKKDIFEAFGKMVDMDIKNFHPDLNKALEKSEEANSQIFDVLKKKAIELWNKKNYK